MPSPRQPRRRLPNSPGRSPQDRCGRTGRYPAPDRSPAPGPNAPLFPEQVQRGSGEFAGLLAEEGQLPGEDLVPVGFLLCFRLIFRLHDRFPLRTKGVTASHSFPNLLLENKQTVLASSLELLMVERFSEVISSSPPRRFSSRRHPSFTTQQQPLHWRPSMALITARAQPTLALTLMASAGQFWAQAPHSMQARVPGSRLSALLFTAESGMGANHPAHAAADAFFRVEPQGCHIRQIDKLEHSQLPVRGNREYAQAARPDTPKRFAETWPRASPFQRPHQLDGDESSRSWRGNRRRTWRASPDSRRRGNPGGCHGGGGVDVGRGSPPPLPSP